MNATLTHAQGGGSSVMREWLAYWRKVAKRARRDSLSLDGWRLYLTAGLAMLRLVLPERLNGLWDKIGPAIVFLLTSYVILAVGEYLWRFLHTPAILDREQCKSLADATLKVSELEANRPKVVVTADGPNLKVENRGAPATFQAKLLVLKEENWSQLKGAHFEALWGKSRKAHGEIPQHGYDHILIGEDPQSLHPGKVRLRFFSQSNQTAEYVSTPGPASLHLQVSIYTIPSALNGPLVREVELTTQGCRLIPPEEAPGDPQPSTHDLQAPPPLPE